MPEGWSDNLGKLDELGRARRISDFLAGQSDPLCYNGTPPIV